MKRLGKSYPRWQLIGPHVNAATASHVGLILNARVDPRVAGAVSLLVSSKIQLRNAGPVEQVYRAIRMRVS